MSFKQLTKLFLLIGLNGLITSLLALIQQPDKPQPLFSFTIYFYILTGVFLMSLASFLVILLHPLPRSFQLRKQKVRTGFKYDIICTINNTCI